VAYWLGRVLGRAGVSPAAVTTAGLVLSLATPFVAAAGPGWPLAAATLVLLSVLADSADGAVAVVTGRSTRLGYVYDSVADRISELSWAAAFWVVGAPWQLLVGCVALSWLHEYARARATAAGMSGIGAVTAGERPSRAAAALVGLSLAGVTGLLAPELAPGVVTVTAAVWALLAAFGFSQLVTAIRLTLR